MENINHEESKKMLGFHYETVMMLLSEMEKRHIIRNMNDEIREEVCMRTMEKPIRKFYRRLNNEKQNFKIMRKI